MDKLQLPLDDRLASPKQIPSAYYYRIPARTIYKNYPVYMPGKEPAGYLDWLKQQEPESAFDASALKTETDWIRAGELVFDSPTFYDNIAQIADVRNPDWYKNLNVPATQDGTLPWFRYVIREKGKVELGTISCWMCHTRVMPDGTVVKGAQGNFPFEQAAALASTRFTSERLLGFERSFFGAPWIKLDPLHEIQQMSFEKIVEMHEAIPPGVIARHGTNPLFPPQVREIVRSLIQGCIAHHVYRSSSIRSRHCRTQIIRSTGGARAESFRAGKDVRAVIHRPSTLTTSS